MRLGAAGDSFRRLGNPRDELVSFWQPDLTVPLAPVFPPEESDV
ncbi:hypothetical protein B4109_1123 [Geobacillus stearothermophilus]|uniref:Uncharacterized protein n=1 Tax=Geobacillus stearothermophilus TaxID=1422 RepID=A0A150M736_GEOSE|nr:hypothetical protein B4109_1123 [Geobacillus stearothermophilus]